MAGADANPDNNPNFRFTYEGQSWTVEQWFNFYNAVNVANIKEAFSKIDKQFKSNKELSELLISEVRSNPRYGNDLIEAFTLDSNGNFNIPLSDPSQTIRIQNLLNSILKSRVTKQKIEGAALIQVSTFGLLEEPKMVYETDPKTGKSRLKYMECYVPCPNEELYNLLLDPNTGELDIDKKNPDTGEYIVPRKYLEAIGYRVPTEDAYSMAPLKIKGFLPKAAGSVIILPREITRIAGSDFDVDKMYVMFHKLTYDLERAKYEYLKQKGVIKAMSKASEGIDNNLTETLRTLDTDEGFNSWFQRNKRTYGEFPSMSVVSFKHNKAVNKDSKSDVYKYVTGRSQDERNSLMIDLMWSYLTNSGTLEKFINPGNFDEQKRASRMITLLKTKSYSELMSIFGSLDKLKSTLLSKLESIYKSMQSSINPLIPTSWVTLHQRNMAGAALIGIAANHNTSHAIMQRTKLRSKKAFLINGNLLSSLHSKLSPEDTYITRNIAGFLAAFVDNAKDPVAGDMNFNTTTADIAFAMLRLGCSPLTVALMISQPAVLDIVKRVTYKGMSLYEATTEVEKFYQERAKTFFPRKPDEYNLTDIKLMEGVNSIQEIDKARDISSAATVNPEVWEFQAQFIIFFKQMMNLGQDLGDLTQATRADTQNGSAGPTEADNIIAVEKLNNVLEKRQKGNLL